MSKDNKKKLGKKFARILSVFLSCAIAVSSFAPVVYATDGIVADTGSNGIVIEEGASVIVNGEEITDPSQLTEVTPEVSASPEPAPEVTASPEVSTAPEATATPEPVTHSLSHKIFMGSGNMCEVPEVGAPVSVKKGDVFAVRFYDNDQLVDVDNGAVKVSDESLTAAGFENANTCGGDDHIDFRVTDSAAAGEATLYFTITFPNGDVLYPTVTVTVVEDSTSERPVFNVSYEWDFSNNNRFKVSTDGTADMYMTLEDAPTGYYYDFLVGTYNHETELIVPVEDQLGTEHYNLGDGRHRVRFFGADLIDYPYVQEYGYIYFAVALLDETTNEIVSSQGFDVFVTDEVSEDTTNKFVADFGYDVLENGNYHMDSDETATFNVVLSNVPEDCNVSFQTGVFSPVTNFVQDMSSPHGVYSTYTGTSSDEYTYTLRVVGSELATYPQVQNNGYIHVAAVLTNSTTNEFVDASGMDIFVDGVTSGDTGSGDAGDDEGQDKEFQEFNGIIEYSFLDSDDQQWYEYDGRSFDTAPSSFVIFRFRHADSSEYIYALDIEDQNQFSKVYDSIFEDGQGNEYNAAEFDNADIGGYTLQYNIEDQYVAYVTVLVTEGNFYGNAMPDVDNTFDGKVNIILGDEQEYTSTYHGTTQGSWTGLKFYTANGAPIGVGAAELVETSEDIICTQHNSEDGFGYWQLEAKSDARVGYHTVDFNVEGYGDYTMVLHVSEYVDTTPAFNGTIQWLEVTDLEDGAAVEKWNTIPNGGTINLDISSKFVFRFMNNDGELVYDDRGGHDGEGLGSDVWTDSEGNMYNVECMNNLPEDNWNFYYYLQDGTKATFDVQTTDNTGLQMMVWDDFQEEYVPLTALNLGQGFQDEIAFFDEDGNQVSGENITGSCMYTIEGEPEITPMTGVDGDNIVVYAYDFDGNPADPAKYVWEIKVNDVYKSMILTITPNENGDDDGTVDYEEEWPGTLEISPAYNWGEDPAESSWMDYDTFMKDFGGFASYGGQVYAVRLKDGDGNIVSTDFYNYSNDMVMCRPSDDKTYYITYYGNLEFIGTYTNTYLVKDLYTDNYKYGKTITVRNEYAQHVETWDDGTVAKVITLSDYTGSIRFVDETSDYVIIYLDGENTITAPMGNPVFDVAGRLSISGTGDLTINFHSAEGKTTAIKAGGSLDSDHNAVDTNGANRTITINDIGTTTGEGDTEETTCYGANVVIGEGVTEIHGTDYVIDGNFIVGDEESLVFIQGSSITAKNINVQGSFNLVEGSKVDAKLITATRHIDISTDSKVNISCTPDEKAGIHAGGSINVLNSWLTVTGNPASTEISGDFSALIYSGDEFYCQTDSNNFEEYYTASVNVSSAADNATAIVAKRMSVHFTELSVYMTGEDSRCLRIFGTDDDSYGVVLFTGNVTLNSDGVAIESTKDIQFGGAESGTVTADISSESENALVSTGGRINLLNEGIRLYGAKGAVVATLDEGDNAAFGYHEDVMLKAGTSADDLVTAFEYADIEGKPYVYTVEPAEGDTVEIAFNTNGGMFAVKNMNKIIGNQYGTLPVPVKKGYRFMYWSADAEGKVIVDPATIVPASSTLLHAQWEEGDANTLYLSGIDTKYYDLGESGGPIFNLSGPATVMLEADNRIECQVLAFVNQSGNITFEGEGNLYITVEEDRAAIESYAKINFNGNGEYYINGTVIANQGIEFNGGYYEIEVADDYALKTSAYYDGASNNIVVNDGAIVYASSTGYNAIYIPGGSLTVNAGGVLLAEASDYAIIAKTATSAKATITVDEDGTLIAASKKAAMQADDYNFDKNNLMVAGFNHDVAKAVTAYSGQRYFATGTSEYVEEGNDEFAGLVVNGHEFAIDEEYEGEGWYYVPNTEFEGQESVNVLYLTPDFRFTTATDVDGIDSYIFSTHDIIIASASEDVSVIAEMAEYADYAEYSLYSLGNAHIHNVVFGDSFADVHANGLYLDAQTELRAGDLIVNGTLSTENANIFVEYTYTVNGDVKLCGDNGEYIDVYGMATCSDYYTNKITGDLILDGVTFTTENTLIVGGDIVVENAVLELNADEGFDTVGLIVDGEVTVNEGSVLSIDSLDCGYLTVNGGTVTAIDIYVKQNLTSENGEIITTKTDGYKSLWVGSTISVEGGELTISGGIDTYKLLIVYGTVNVVNADKGIDAGIVAMSRGTLNVDASQIGIFIHRYDSTSALYFNGGEVNIEGGDFAIYLFNDTQATFNGPFNKYEAKIKLHGGTAAIYTGGTLVTYGALTADNIDGMTTPVKKYDGQEYLYVNIRTFFGIDVAETENGTVSVDKTTVDAGETVTVTATPDKGYTLDAIYVDGEKITGNTFQATDDHIVKAVFGYKKLTKPTVTLTNVSSTGKIKISWTAVDGAKEYKVYRATSKTGTYSLLKTTTDTSFTNTSTTAGKTYYYKVMAIHPEAAGNSDYSEIKSRTCDLPITTVTAANVTSTGKIKVSWTAVDGAEEYKVYRATSENGSYSLIKTTTGTSLTNTSVTVGTTYYYKVIAVHATTAANSAYSAVDSAICRLARPAVTAENIASTGKIQLSWSAISNAEGYEVWRSARDQDAYELLDTITAVTYTDETAQAGTEYDYKVKAVHANSAANSVYSAVVSITCDLPTTTVTLTNVASSGKIKISWTAVDGAKEYKVYRATSKTGTYSLLSTTTGTSLTNTSTAAGKTYYYKVMAVHANSAANSAYSAIKSRTCDLARPTVTVTNVASTGKIKVSWTAVDGAKEYKVYRATSENGSYSLLKTTTGTSLTNTSVTVGTTYYYKVIAVHATTAANSAESAVDSAICRLARPAVTAENIASTGKIQLSWSAISNAEGYEVWRSASEQGTYERLDTITAVTYTDETAEAGTAYYYFVRAIHADTAANSAESVLIGITCDLPTTTVTLTNVASSGKIKISWTAVEGAAKYKVYRATSKTGTYKLLSTTTGTSLTNTSVTAGTTYYYKVVAVHTNEDANSAYSAIKSRTCDLARPTVTVTNVASTGKIKVSWKAVSGAKEYKVYRATSENGSYSLIKTTTGTSLTNTSVTVGTTYYYKVMAIHAKSAANSAYSVIDSAVCKLARPTVSTYKLSDTGKILIDWTEVSGAVSYDVYRSTSKSSGYELLDSTNNAAYEDLTAETGTMYYYKVMAMHSDEAASSAYSSVVSETCGLPKPVVKTSNVASTGKIKLTWNAVEGAVKYEVYRATSKNGTYSQIKTTTGTSFTNTSTTAGKTYYYTVLAVHANTAANSDYSAIVSRTCDLARPTVSVTLTSAEKPKVTWKAISGASKYEVYRATSENGSYSLIKTTTGTSLTNTSATAGTTYYYKVKAIHSNSGANSAFSTVKYVTAGPQEENFIAYYVAEPTTNIYTDTDSNSSYVKLKYMDEVQIDESALSSADDKWVKVKYNDKIYYSWIESDSAKFTKIKSDYKYINDNNNDIQNGILELALKYKDLPTYYAHEQSTGEINPDNGKYGFDCSGFVGYVYETVVSKYNPLYTISQNITTLYQTETMYNKGFNNQFDAQDIAMKDMRPGDVIFFKLDGSDSKTVDHCGIYLGNNEFIHATGYIDGVCIFPMIDTYYDNIVEIRRYAPDTVVPANQSVNIDPTIGYARLFPERDSNSTEIYTFSKGEALTLLYTSSNDTWGYVRTTDGLEGYVLMKYVVK